MKKNNTPVLYSPVPILVVICGATATGKSGLAIALAQRLNQKSLKSVILSADSRQVYREFDLGTAKPSIADQQLVPHRLIDICEPTETLTVAAYQQQAQGLIRQIGEANKTSVPLLVGGTGLYIRSIVRGLLIPRVPPQPELRSQLQGLGQPQCYQLLQQVDAVAAQKIHPNDPVRTLRALEVFYVTGKPISAQQGEIPPDYPIMQIGLDCADPESLGRRIQQRTAQMIADGFVAEVAGLCQKYGADLPLLNTLGYQEIKQYLAGEVSLGEAESLIGLHTRQFAKRQRTWFRADRSIEWFDADAGDLVERVWERMNAERGTRNAERGTRKDECGRMNAEG
jgi:tRNA dimethylallyltransferase